MSYRRPGFQGHGMIKFMKIMQSLIYIASVLGKTHRDESFFCRSLFGVFYFSNTL